MGEFLYLYFKYFFNCDVVIKKYALSNYKDLGGAYIHHREGHIKKKRENNKVNNKIFEGPEFL